MKIPEDPEWEHAQLHPQSRLGMPYLGRTPMDDLSETTFLEKVFLGCAVGVILAAAVGFGAHSLGVL